MKLTNRIKEKIISILEPNYFKSLPKKTHLVFIQNINKDYNVQSQKKALISYITQPFITDANKDLPHTNYRESIQILNVLIESNYNVDICHFQDLSVVELIKQKKYDLIIGLGEPFYNATKLNPNATRIIYCAVEYFDSAKIKIEERLNYHFKRHEIMPIVKPQNYYLKHHFENIDCIIHKGNKVTKASYQKAFPNTPIHSIISAPYSNPYFKENKRNISKSRNTFLWFGSKDIYCKGLDILTDVFKENPDKKLIIAGVDLEELKKLNTITENITHIGFINLQSNKFIELMNEASFIIFPSCSEGMASGVLTCMNHGLIPIITKECGIDIQNDLGKIIENFSVENISNIVKSTSEISDEELFRTHENIFQQTRTNYNINNYSKTLNAILDELNKPF